MYRYKDELVLSFVSRLKSTGTIGIEMGSFVLYREVSFIWRF